MMSGRRRWAMYACLAAILLALPFFGGHYYTFLLATILIYTLVAMSLNVLIGMGGLISIGHAGFWALGAYTSALLVTKLGAPFLVGILCGGVMAAIFGALVALPALRVHGHYLAIATLGFALFTQQALYEWESLTGGRHGLTVPRPEIFGFSLDTDREFYFVLLVIVLLCFWVTANLKRSHAGHGLTALKMSMIAAQCSGVNRPYHVILAFVVSAFFTGLSGGLFAHLIGYLSTETFSLVQSLAFLTMAVIGGLNSFLGPVLGAIYLTLAPEFLRQFESAQMVIYGLILILFMRFLPGGLASLPEVAARAARRMRASRAERS